MDFWVVICVRYSTLKPRKPRNLKNFLEPRLSAVDSGESPPKSVALVLCRFALRSSYFHHLWHLPLGQSYWQHPVNITRTATNN